jgi:peptidoglycan/LPS O-acetylase OafA/YrhL
MKYRPEIDGLRALAVLPVILFHAGFEWFSGGFIGVDVFFVISGYLITTILIEDLNNDRFSIVNFYERRARRILPALFFVMFACIPFAWFWMLPSQMIDFSESLVAVSLFVSNILFWQKSSYFAAAAEDNPLLHTWSLAVEEQYYLLFPIFLLMTWRFGKNKVFWMIVVLAVSSLGLSEWGWRNSASASFYLAPTRAWELLSGSIAAFFIQKHGVQSNNVLSLFGLAAIIFAMMLYGEDTPFPSVYALVPVLGVVLLVLFADKKTFSGRLLSAKPLVSIGLISYSAYLWHQPLLAFTRIRFADLASNMLVNATLSAAAVFLGYLSWRWIEKPFRDPNVYSRKIVFSFSSLIVVGFILFGVYVDKNNGLPNRVPDVAKFEANFPTIKNGYCFYAVTREELSLSLGADGTECNLGDASGSRSGILIGDSFAGQYEPLWDVVGQKLGIKVNAITTNACFPSLDSSYRVNGQGRAYEQCVFNRNFFRENISKYDVVILGAAWGDYVKFDFVDEIKKIIAEVSKNEALMVIMSAPKYHDLDLLAVYRNSRWRGVAINYHSVPSMPDAEMLEANLTLERIARKHKNVIFIDRSSLFSSDGVPSDWMENGIPYAYDKRHIGISGSLEAAKNLIKSTALDDLKSKSSK